MKAARWGGKAWVALWAAIVLVVIGICAATRMSYTDYGADPAALGNLPYLYQSASHQALDPSSKLSGSSDMVDTSTLIDDTPVIVSGVFDGDRAYGYQAFVSQVRITHVYRGDGLAAGQTLPVFESVGVQRMSWLSDWKQRSPSAYDAFTKRFGAGDAAPAVIRPTAGVGLHGGMLMRPGQEYLLFLSPQAYPPVENRAGKAQEYLVKDNPYALIALPVGQGAAKVGALDPEADFISMIEAQDYSLVLSDAADENLYRQTAEALVQSVAQTPFVDAGR